MSKAGPRTLLLTHSHLTSRTYGPHISGVSCVWILHFVTSLIIAWSTCCTHIPTRVCLPPPCQILSHRYLTIALHHFPFNFRGQACSYQFALEIVRLQSNSAQPLTSSRYLGKVLVCLCLSFPWSPPRARGGRESIAKASSKVITERYHVDSWKMVSFINFFWWNWGLNSGLCTCKAWALPLEPCFQSTSFWLFWRWGLLNYLPWLTSNLDSAILMMSRMTHLSHWCLAKMAIFKVMSLEWGSRFLALNVGDENSKTTPREPHAL
jgi:hypothetical protein